MVQFVKKYSIVKRFSVNIVKCTAQFMADISKVAPCGAGENVSVGGGGECGGYRKRVLKKPPAYGIIELPAVFGCCTPYTSRPTTLSRHSGGEKSMTKIMFVCHGKTLA